MLAVIGFDGHGEWGVVMSCEERASWSDVLVGSEVVNWMKARFRYPRG